MIYISVLSQNLKLILTEASDTDKKFLDYRTELSGNVESNMTKIDDAFGNVQNHINDKTNPHKVSLEQIGAEKSGTSRALIDEHNISESAHENIINKIPTKISQLENDKGYIIAELDPTVPGWAKEPNKPTYTPEEIGASSPPKVITIVLLQDQWINNEQTVSVSGVSSVEGEQLIQPVPYINDQSDYINSIVICKSQSDNSLTFSCDEVPVKNLNVYIVIQEVATE